MAKKEYPYPDSLYKELWEKFKSDLQDMGKFYSKQDSNYAAKQTEFYRSLFKQMCSLERGVKMDYIYEIIQKRREEDRCSDFW